MAFCEKFSANASLRRGVFLLPVIFCYNSFRDFFDNLEFLQVKKISENTHKRSKNNEQQKLPELF